MSQTGECQDQSFQRQAGEQQFFIWHRVQNATQTTLTSDLINVATGTSVLNEPFTAEITDPSVIVIFQVNGPSGGMPAISLEVRDTIGGQPLRYENTPVVTWS